MTDPIDTQTVLGDVSARTLSNSTKTVPMLSTITPRWLVHLLQWIPVEAGVYRVNKVKNETGVVTTQASSKPRKYFLKLKGWNKRIARKSILDGSKNAHRQLRAVEV